jgi:long-subunit acyl-CoA synthetase (AMP-forming)
MTYVEVGAARTAVGSGLVQNGIPKGSCVGLYMINRPEWVITELACGSYSYISVPLYDTLGMLTKPSVMNTLIAIVSKPQLVFLAQISDDELF